MGSQPDLAQAIQFYSDVLALKPENPGALNALCWGYALAEQPAEALPYGDRAVAADPSGTSRDSRAVAYAQLGRLAEAAADIRAFLAWAGDEPSGGYAALVPERQAWLAALQAGRNPLDRAILERLRDE